MEKQKMVAPDIKQVILVRNDLNMSPGKAAAQVGHAAILFMVHDLHQATDESKIISPSVRELKWMYGNGPMGGENGTAIIYGGMKKVVLGVEDLTELWELFWEAKDSGIKSYAVFDEGVNDITACGLGPDYSDKIDKITGSLELYGPHLDKNVLTQEDLETTPWYPSRVDPWYGKKEPFYKEVDSPFKPVIKHNDWYPQLNEWEVVTRGTRRVIK